MIEWNRPLPVSAKPVWEDPSALRQGDKVAGTHPMPA